MIDYWMKQVLTEYRIMVYIVIALLKVRQTMIRKNGHLLTVSFIDFSYLSTGWMIYITLPYMKQVLTLFKSHGTVVLVPLEIGRILTRRMTSH